ncbi:hypothetical protein Tco_1407045 [Tanacetum coccineum]
MAKRAQPALYDADTLLHLTHPPVSIWDSEEALVQQVVSMKKMSEKPGHVRPANGFYEKLNALMFVPQHDLSLNRHIMLLSHKRASPEQVIPNVLSLPLFIKVDLQVKFCPVFDKLMLLFINLKISSKKEQQKNQTMFLNGVLIMQNSLLNNNCKTPSSASNAIFEINKKLRMQLQGKNDTWIRNLGNSDQHHENVEYGLGRCKEKPVSLKRRYDELSQANTHSRTANTEKLSALTAENTKLKAQVTGKTSSGPSTSEKPKVLASGIYNIGQRDVLLRYYCCKIDDDQRRLQLQDRIASIIPASDSNGKLRKEDVVATMMYSYESHGLVLTGTAPLVKWISINVLGQRVIA